MFSGTLILQAWAWMNYLLKLVFTPWETYLGASMDETHVLMFPYFVTFNEQWYKK